jgi:hypothetical protein
VPQGFVVGFGRVAKKAIPTAVRKLGQILHSRQTEEASFYLIRWFQVGRV